MRRWLESQGFTQDPDVLDTWFSSWLWPFATMGWPEQTRDVEEILSDHRPRHRAGHHFLLGRAHDHGGLRVHGTIMPFQNVYFTGIIRDKQGRKMSKTLGNSPDPLELIAKYGADALRFGTMRSAPLGQDVLVRRKGRRARPQFLQQALERLPFPPDAGRRSARAKSSARC